MIERLQKTLAKAGIASRRHCELLIAAGRVTVNGQKVTQMGVRVDPETDDIRFDGTPLRHEDKAYYLLNKPQGYLTTQSDEFGRKRAADLLVGINKRVYPVGRLDRDSEGLLLFTNDGKLAQELTHPRYSVPKTYLVMIEGLAPPGLLERLYRGVHLAEGLARITSGSLRYSSYETSAFEIILQEGHNRELRRILAKLGCKVKYLRRIRIGNLTDHGLPAGHFRELKAQEVQDLYSLVRAPEKSAPNLRRRKKNRP